MDEGARPYVAQELAGKKETHSGPEEEKQLG